MATMANQPQPLSEDGEIYLLILAMLQASPCRQTAALLLQEASEHGLLPCSQPSVDGAPALPFSFAELQLRHPCPADQLRGLLRRVPRRSKGGSGGGLLGLQVSDGKELSAPATGAQADSLVQLLRQRELAGSRLSRRPSIEQLKPQCASQLLLGKARFGLRGLVDGHSNSTYCVAFDATGERVITGADDNLIKVWSSRTCFLLRSLRGHRGEITDLSIHPSGRVLASSSNDGTVRLWALSHLQVPCIAVLSAPNAVPSSSMPSPIVTASWRPPSTVDGTPELLAVSQEGDCYLWYVAPQAGAESGVQGLYGWKYVAVKMPVSGEADFVVFQAAWSPGGVRFAVGTTDCVAHVFYAGSPCAAGADGPPCAAAWVATLRGHKHDVTSIAWSCDGERLATGSKDGTVRLWRLKGAVTGGRVLGASDRQAESWSSKLLGRLPEANAAVPVIGAVAWTCNGQHVVSSSTDGTVVVWCGQTGVMQRNLTISGCRAHTREVYVLNCHPLLPNIAMSASYDGCIVLWDLLTGESVQVLRHPCVDDISELVNGEWSNDGTALALTDMGGRMMLFGVSLNAASPADLPLNAGGGSTELASGQTRAPFEQFFAGDTPPVDVGPFAPEVTTGTEPTGGIELILSDCADVAVTPSPMGLLLDRQMAPYGAAEQAAILCDVPLLPPKGVLERCARNTAAMAASESMMMHRLLSQCASRGWKRTPVAPRPCTSLIPHSSTTGASSSNALVLVDAHLEDISSAEEPDEDYKAEVAEAEGEESDDSCASEHSSDGGHVRRRSARHRAMVSDEETPPNTRSRRGGTLAHMPARRPLRSAGSASSHVAGSSSFPQGRVCRAAAVRALARQVAIRQAFEADPGSDSDSGPKRRAKQRQRKKLHRKRAALKRPAPRAAKRAKKTRKSDSEESDECSAAEFDSEDEEESVPEESEGDDGRHDDEDDDEEEEGEEAEDKRRSGKARAGVGPSKRRHASRAVLSDTDEEAEGSGTSAGPVGTRRANRSSRVSATKQRTPARSQTAAAGSSSASLQAMEGRQRRATIKIPLRKGKGRAAPSESTGNAASSSRDAARNGRPSRSKSSKSVAGATPGSEQDVVEYTQREDANWLTRRRRVEVMLDPEKEPEMCGRWYVGTIQSVSASKQSAVVKFDDLVEDDEETQLIEEHAVHRMRPTPPEPKADEKASWVASLQVEAPLEVLWDDAYWPSRVLALLGRPSAQEARKWAAAAKKAKDSEEPCSDDEDPAMFAAMAEEVERQDAEQEEPQPLFQIAAVGYEDQPNVVSAKSIRRWWNFLQEDNMWEALNRCPG